MALSLSTCLRLVVLLLKKFESAVTCCFFLAVAAFCVSGPALFFAMLLRATAFTCTVSCEMPLVSRLLLQREWCPFFHSAGGARPAAAAALVSQMLTQRRQSVAALKGRASLSMRRCDRCFTSFFFRCVASFLHFLTLPSLS